MRNSLSDAKERTVLCGNCSSVVASTFAVKNGVPIGYCPRCDHKMTLLQPGQPDIQNRGLSNA